MLLFDKDHGPNVEPRQTEEAPLMLRRLVSRADDTPAEAPYRWIGRKKKIVVFDTEKGRGDHTDLIPQKLADAGYEVTRVLLASGFQQPGFVKEPPARVPTTIFSMLKRKAKTGTPYDLRIIRDERAARRLLEEWGPDAIVIDQFFYASRPRGYEWAEMAAKTCPSAKVILQEWGSQSADSSWVDREQERALAPAYVTVRPTEAALDEIAHYLTTSLGRKGHHR